MTRKANGGKANSKNQLFDTIRADLKAATNHHDYKPETTTNGNYGVSAAGVFVFEDSSHRRR